MKILTWNKFNEGITMKSSKSGDNYNKKESFRKKVEDLIKSMDIEYNRIGDDFELLVDDDMICQIMFRDEYMSVRKSGSKFPKDFKYSELGKMKSEILDIIKNK
jgi:hypothetical protein